MKAITPEQFKQAFLRIVGAYELQIVQYWDASRDYTLLMMDTILPEIARQLELNVYNRDYYTLDAVFYEDINTSDFRSIDTYVKYIAVAIEHENLLPGSRHEIYKLQLFNTPLKVLITYTNYPNDRRNKQTFLTRYADIVKDADVFSDISTLRRQLVIFGNKSGIIAEWTFYVYESGAFIAL